MGGKVLELESDKLIEQGLELGRLENQMAMEKNHEFCNSPLLTSPTNKSNMNYNAMAR